MKIAGACTISVLPDRVIHPRFGGVGFHCSEHEHAITRDLMDRVLAKRWRELRPSFARLSDFCDWSPARREVQADYIRMMRETGTEVYLTTWNPKNVPEGLERAAYAKRVVDYLEFLVRVRGCSNLKYYCMTNELTLRQWGALIRDLPTFKDYHRCLHHELAARKLDIKLLATDASPVENWTTLEWAAKNMDEITGVYGGHHYINDFTLEDPGFYGWFLGKTAWAAGLAGIPAGRTLSLASSAPSRTVAPSAVSSRTAASGMRRRRSRSLASRSVRPHSLPSTAAFMRWGTGPSPTIPMSTPGESTGTSGAHFAGRRTITPRAPFTTGTVC